MVFYVLLIISCHHFPIGSFTNCMCLEKLLVVDVSICCIYVAMSHRFSYYVHLFGESTGSMNAIS